MTRKFNAFKLTPAYSADYKLKTCLTIEKNLNDFQRKTRKGLPIFPIREFQYKDKYFIGILNRVNTQSIGSITNIESKESNNINVNEDEGIGYCTCFLYDLITNIVFLESSRPGQGVSINNFIDFLESNYDIWGIKSELVLNGTAYETYRRLNTITKFEINVVYPETEVTQGAIHHKQLDEIKNSSNANNLNFSVSNKKTNGLFAPFIEPFISLRNDENVRKLTCKGYEDGIDEMQVVDFIKDRLIIEVSAITDKFQQNVAQALLPQLEEKYLDEVRDQLQKLYKVKYE